MRLLLGTLLATALGWTPGARALDEEYRASSYVFGTLVEVTALDDDPGRAQRAVARVLREFDRMHRELHAWQPAPLVALNEAIARGEKDIATTREIATRIVHAQPRMEDLAVNGNRVSSANREVRLDFGGYAKGYALDQAARILRDEGVSSA